MYGHAKVPQAVRRWILPWNPCSQPHLLALEKGRTHVQNLHKGEKVSATVIEFCRECGDYLPDRPGSELRIKVEKGRKIKCLWNLFFWAWATIHSKVLVCDRTQFDPGTTFWSNRFPEHCWLWSLSTEAGVIPEHSWSWPPNKVHKYKIKYNLVSGQVWSQIPYAKLQVSVIGEERWDAEQETFYRQLSHSLSRTGSQWSPWLGVQAPPVLLQASETRLPLALLKPTIVSESSLLFFQPSREGWEAKCLRRHFLSSPKIAGKVVWLAELSLECGRWLDTITVSPEKVVLSWSLDCPMFTVIPRWGCWQHEGYMWNGKG